MRASTARTDCSRCWMSARLGGRRLRRDDFLDLLDVRKDEREASEVSLEVKDDDESAQFFRAQRVIARSKRVARVPRRPPGRRKEPEDMLGKDFREAADPWSGVWTVECLSPRTMSSSSMNSSSMNSSSLMNIFGGKSCRGN